MFGFNLLELASAMPQYLAMCLEMEIVSSASQVSTLTLTEPSLMADATVETVTRLLLRPLEAVAHALLAPLQ